MNLALIALISGFLFYNLIKNKKYIETGNYTKLDQLIKHLKENHSINNIEWNKNHIKLSDDNNGLLIGDNDTHLIFNNNENIILYFNNEKISLNTIDTSNAINKLQQLIDETKETIDLNKLTNDNKLMEENINKLNKLNNIYDILNNFKNYYYYNKYLKYKNKYLLNK